MADQFSDQRVGLTSPGTRFAAITPADEDLAEVPRAVFVGEAGTLVITGRDGGVVTIASAASQYHPIRPARIGAASTAAGIVAIY